MTSSVRTYNLSAAEVDAAGPHPRRRVDLVPRPLVHFEVQMRPSGVARRALVPDDLAGLDLLAGAYGFPVEVAVVRQVTVAVVNEN
jgi:hypothetical protein